MRECDWIVPYSDVSVLLLGNKFIWSVLLLKMENSCYTECLKKNSTFQYKTDLAAYLWRSCRSDYSLCRLLSLFLSVSLYLSVYISAYISIRLPVYLYFSHTLFCDGVRALFILDVIKNEWHPRRKVLHKTFISILRSVSLLVFITSVFHNKSFLEKLIPFYLWQDLKPM